MISKIKIKARYYLWAGPLYILSVGVAHAADEIEPLKKMSDVIKQSLLSGAGSYVAYCLILAVGVAGVIKTHSWVPIAGAGMACVLFYLMTKTFLS